MKLRRLPVNFRRLADQGLHFPGYASGASLYSFNNRRDNPIPLPEKGEEQVLGFDKRMVCFLSYGGGVIKRLLGL
ncbi:MAG: hypothetical protein FWH41_09560 [Treponema sp.]|nr:hypothetical protein [Treponema sp.]